MKKIRITITLCILLLIAAGCKKNNTSDEPTTPSIVGNEAKPEWIMPDNSNPTQSMTMLVKVDLSNYAEELAQVDYKVSENDLLAAFMGEQCVGTAVLVDGLFQLYIINPNADSNPNSDDTQIKLMYYSSELKNIFISLETLAFINDQHLGTFSEPFSPVFALVH